MSKVIVISGPTGIGKTALSCKLARMFNLPLVNADASQMRKNMDIGTANVTDEEIKGIENYLFKFLEPASDFSIKDYQDLARPIIDKCETCIMVGGSGLYIDSALLDYDLTTNARDKNADYNLTNNQLYDRNRVLRYLEIAGNAKKEAKELYDILFISLDCDRHMLYDAINKRFDKMIDAGWLEEVKKLRIDGYEIDKIKEIGYKELDDYLINNLDFNNISEIIKQKTRNYAKRQLTWFRGSKNKYHNYHLINLDLDNNINDLVKQFLNN